MGKLTTIPVLAMWSPEAENLELNVNWKPRKEFCMRAYASRVQRKGLASSVRLVLTSAAGVQNETPPLNARRFP